MSRGFGYLKPNVVAEPLVEGCYAWTYLIPSATGALNLTARHSPPIKSAIPAMPDGPFAGQYLRLQARHEHQIYGRVKFDLLTSHAGKTRRLRGITAKRLFENKEILLP